MTAFTEITYRVAGRVAVVSLARPELANAVSRRTTRELDAAFQRACEDDAVGCILLRGEGAHFSSGHDLGSPASLSDSKSLLLIIVLLLLLPSSYFFFFFFFFFAPLRLRLLTETAPQETDPRPRGAYLKWRNNDVEACLRWRRLRKPLVCALRGYCIYHGTVLAACADLCVAADDLRFMPSLVEANLFPWAVHLQAQKIKEILFTQRFVLAPEALALGIVNRVVPAAALDGECMALCQLIAKGDGYHLWMMKKMVNAAQDAAGMEGHVRAGLDTWTAFRRDWYEGAGRAVKTRDHGGDSKKLAPVKQSLRGEAWRLSLLASRL
jgi:enoyl-CoA hydratase